MNVPNFGPETNPARLRDWARVVEGLGYDLLMVSDHVVITPDVEEQYPEPFFEPFTTLSWLAGITDRVRLGTTVLIAPYRHPLLTARMATNLNALSDGRLILGVGAGWAQQEFAALGADFAARGRATDEVLAALPKDIPLWIGGNSPAALRRAVRFGTAWHPLRQTLPQLRTGLARLYALAKTADQTSPTPGFAPRILLRLTDEPLADDERIAGEGSVEQVLDDLAVLRELGASTVVLDPFVGDPAETERPEAAWQQLATIIDNWRRRDT
ncbi:LLM class flavin-dependent oxidoreductase [Kribbella jejuensis]|uniref:Alkanesulfonate monooxygenase SsuD/methylene tetrahydromethanopterin reductase-like flavin-dependent oxidoreductase (Luciferase family) n=1 Tax=Kribbella jejuensis TaxID=236068 RepID=A0A542DTU3_9ACTN|nr:alkanesulfonate monooxygenase SsuD/methylene tetrahydromethanopterin reductase-like flavin-dependent oxidoreductase (luciferase family) [Kribbella jejuensis]